MIGWLTRLTGWRWERWCPTPGSDEEQALVTASKLAFPNSKHLYCMLHCKDNVRHHLTSIGVPTYVRESVLTKMFSCNGISEAGDEDTMTNRITELMQYVRYNNIDASSICRNECSQRSQQTTGTSGRNNGLANTSGPTTIVNRRTISSNYRFYSLLNGFSFWSCAYHMIWNSSHFGNNLPRIFSYCWKYLWKYGTYWHLLKIGSFLHELQLLNNHTSIVPIIKFCRKL